MTEYIIENSPQHGVEPICKILHLAPSTFYAAKNRPPSARELHDEHLKDAVEFVWGQNRNGTYGAYKVWRQLNRNGVPVARCTVERLMRELGFKGVRRGKVVRTTIGGDAADRPDDLVQRNFVATRPNQLWVVDLTYVKTHSGWVYVAFVVDVFSRRVVGWQASRSLKTDLALDALEMAIWMRKGEDLSGLIHHSDRGVQYVSFRYSARLIEAGIDPSVGSKGDSYDNALAESFNGLYKAELIYKDGPWQGLQDVEYATLEYVDWFNKERLHGSVGDAPPVEFEAAYYLRRAQQDAETEDEAGEKQGAVTRFATPENQAATDMTLANPATQEEDSDGLSQAVR